MKEAKICPMCGAPQPWEMWRQCHCGYDAGAGEDMADQAVEPDCEQMQEDEAPFYRRHDRLLRRLFFGSALIVLVTSPIHALHWVTEAVVVVGVALLWVPFKVWPRE